MKAEPLSFDLLKSAKNYLFVPLKLDAGASKGLSYSIDTATVLSFAERNLGAHTLSGAAGLGSGELQKAVFFSRFDPQLCF